MHLKFFAFPSLCLLGVLQIFPSLSLLACPGLVTGRELPLSGLGKVRRQDMRLYVLTGSGETAWVEAPLQIDPLDEEGNLVFPKDPQFFTKVLEATDRLSFAPETLGKKWEASRKAPCIGGPWVEWEVKGRFGYLGACPEAPGGIFPEPVKLDEKARVVGSKFYRYHYSERNHLVFDSISLAEKSLQNFYEVAKDSDLLITADLRRFFTLRFDSDDIDAFITHKRQGAMGLMGGLQFYLKILFFHIELSLMPEINFFEQALFMPMTLHLPSDAKAYLRRGSGIFYSWEKGADTVWDWQESRLEDLDFSVLEPDRKDGPVPPSFKFCTPQKCRYSIKGSVKDRHFLMNFVISRKAAELGFYPRLIRDVEALEKKLDRRISRYKANPNRVGLYFETALMPKGSHTWDFWISFPEENDARDCSTQVNSSIYRLP